MIYFAGRDLAKHIRYLKAKGKELNLSINYPPPLEPFIKAYIKIFGIPEIGFQVRFDFFRRCLSIIKGQIFIDAGCGSGEYTRLVSKKYPKAIIYAFDHDSSLIKLCQKISHSANTHYFEHDLTKPIKKIAKADAAWCIDVLEHIKDYKIAFGQLSDLVKKNGYLIIHVPQPKQRRWFGVFKKWVHEDHAHEGVSEKALMANLPGFKIVYKRPTFGAVGSFIWELNTLFFTKIPPLGALSFPFFRILVLLDWLIPSKKNNCLGIMLQKVSD